jgi:D-alanyl-D-alanine carboxypeptidase
VKKKVLITILLISALSVGGYFAYLYLFPQNLLNPFSRESLKLETLYPKLEEKITKKETLQLDKVEEISSLEKTPRYLVYNPDTRIVYASKNQSQKFSPASFTKLLTSQVALDMVSPDTLITATSTSIDKIPTILGLKVGEQLTVKELIRASIVTSANDAAATIAEGIVSNFDLPTEDFIVFMNHKSSLLGMKDSHFANPEGYDDPDQYSTLEDLVLLIDNLENYPQVASAAATDRDDLIETSTHGFYYLPNWNGLLGVYPGISGLKIAYTEEAGYGSIVTAQREGVNVVAIVSGADSIPERDLAAAALLDQAFIKEKIKPANITKADLQIRYKQWSDLSVKIRQELDELEKNK